MDGLAQILLITWSFANFSAAKDFVRANGGAEIEAIIGVTVQLDDIIKTKIASSDMATYVVPSGTTFRKGTMTDEFGQGGEDISKCVIHFFSLMPLIGTYGRFTLNDYGTHYLHLLF